MALSSHVVRVRWSVSLEGLEPRPATKLRLPAGLAWAAAPALHRDPSCSRSRRSSFSCWISDGRYMCHCFSSSRFLTFSNRCRRCRLRSRISCADRFGCQFAWKNVCALYHRKPSARKGCRVTACI